MYEATGLLKGASRKVNRIWYLVSREKALKHVKQWSMLDTRYEQRDTSSGRGTVLRGEQRDDKGSL